MTIISLTLCRRPATDRLAVTFVSQGAIRHQISCYESPYQSRNIRTEIRTEPMFAMENLWPGPLMADCWLQHIARKQPHVADRESERAAVAKTAKVRSVQRSPARHLPQFQGIERFFPTWNGRAGSARLSDSSCACRSTSPWFSASYACRRLSDLRYYLSDHRPMWVQLSV